MNKPFDQRVINHLERPTSGDLNTAQSQINLGGRALMRQLLQPNPAVVGTGSLGESFFVEKVVGEDRKFKIKRGVGFNYAAYNASTDLNIDGIVGLSDPFDYRMVTLQSDEGVEITVEPGPGAGLCRRDVIAIRCTNPSTNQLVPDDYTDTDIYDPTLNKFDAVSKPKTFSYDLTGSVPQVLDYTQVGSATDAVVYIKGAVSPYSGPDSLLSAPATTIPSGYINIAIVNVVELLPTIAQSDVVDFRRLVAPQGNLVVSGSATVGANDSGQPGKALSNVSFKTPPGLKAQILKWGDGAANSYLLIVYGPRVVSSATISYSTGASGPTYADLSQGLESYTVRPVQVVQGPTELNLGCNSAVKALAANASISSPTQQVAIGQPYHLFPFTLCRVDNVTSTVTEPLTLSLNLDPLVIEDPPDYPSSWPAGIRPVQNYNTTRTFYMNWNDFSPTPLVGLPSPTYYLNDIPSQVEDTYSASLSAGTTRVAGFVTGPGVVSNITIPTGVWRISLNMSSQSDAVRVLARAYLYDGSTNPELGTLIGESNETYIYDGTSTLRYQDLFIPITGPISTGSNRVYIVLYAVSSAGPQGITIKFNGGSPAVVATNIPNEVPVVTIEQPATPYPGGTYPLSGSATSTPVQINVAGEVQKLNAKASFFSSQGSTLARTVPITFTLNLTVE